jgi:hypothetical protein
VVPKQTPRDKNAERVNSVDVGPAVLFLGHRARFCFAHRARMSADVQYRAQIQTKAQMVVFTFSFLIISIGSLKNHSKSQKI